MPYKFLDDLFPTEDEMKHYLSHPFPFNLPLVKERLDKKIEEDPEYEVFLPFYYHRIESKLKSDASTKVISLPYLFISNRGKVISNNLVEAFKEIPHTIHPGGYVNVRVAIAGKAHTLAVHRALGCVFIPLTEEQLSQGLHPKDLEVNHINGVKTIFDLSNLEWSTRLDNIKHAVETGLVLSGKENTYTKPVKGRVIRGKYIGYEFVLFGGTHVEKYGFDQAATSNAANGNLLSHGNCKWFFATEEEIQNLPHEIPNEITKDLKDTCPIAKNKLVGVHTVTGEVVDFIGDKKGRELGFNMNAIRNNIAGLTKSHKGYAWHYEPLDTGL